MPFKHFSLIQLKKGGRKICVLKLVLCYVQTCLCGHHTAQLLNYVPFYA